MILPDINILLYAYNPHVRQHVRAVEWWERAMQSDELIGLPNEVGAGFIRIATNKRLGAAAVPLTDAWAVVRGWLDLPQVRVLVPGPGHLARAVGLTEQAMGSGALLSDAILAAYAIEHRATLCSNDADFARFPGLDWRNPLAG
jgi:hypothetical protein